VGSHGVYKGEDVVNIGPLPRIGRTERLNLSQTARLWTTALTVVNQSLATLQNCNTSFYFMADRSSDANLRKFYLSSFSKNERDKLALAGKRIISPFNCSVLSDARFGTRSAALHPHAGQTVIRRRTGQSVIGRMEKTIDAGRQTLARRSASSSKRTSLDLVSEMGAVESFKNFSSGLFRPRNR